MQPLAPANTTQRTQLNETYRPLRAAFVATMTSTTQTNPDYMTRLNPLALAVAFGVAGLVVAVVFTAVMGGMWGMMGSNVGWMHGSAGTGPAYGGSMMGGGPGFVFSAIVCGFLGGALAGGVSAAVYNNIVGRSA